MTQSCEREMSQGSIGIILYFPNRSFVQDFCSYHSSNATDCPDWASGTPDETLTNNYLL
jgi:hypothetical protein